MPYRLTRRDFSVRAAVAAGVGLAASKAAFGASADDISHAAESIHQDVTIKAAAKRVYDALTDAAQFTKLNSLSGMTNLAPAQIGGAAGDAFSLFGGHIVGRHVELVPDRRIVQAWRAADWEPGLYSIARFELVERNGQTTIAFDHTGFPKGAAEHLAEGWKSNYWEPLTKYLAG